MRREMVIEIREEVGEEDTADTARALQRQGCKRDEGMISHYRSRPVDEDAR
mgnify:FL=1|jgi:hypothetical protein